ncbi:hypothetical protein VHEMI07403 [[Torrubiella] hemipterigena]|uniref:Transcription factor domain-containing protein n=1 Tax=[Torrubiella] hemipterigena TaxID=1531966 RepID=A0A0A1TLC0_9HYPO|nr:hypothetical protein VHEMI07403 [[Torrubiella] hemipterigena]
MEKDNAHLRQPLAFRFIEQSGYRVAGSSHGVIRSHAMREVRNRQKLLRHSNNQTKKKCDNTTKGSGRLSPRNPSQGIPSQICLENHIASVALLPQLSVVEIDNFVSITELLPRLFTKFPTEINIIKRHALSFSPSNLTAIIFPVALQSPGLLASMLYMTYSHLATTRGTYNKEVALALKGLAMVQINQKLKHPSTATCTKVLAAIAYLSTGTWIFGSPFEEIEAHFKAIEYMVEQRGMPSLGVYQFGKTVRKYLLQQHMLLVALHARPPVSSFQFDYVTQQEPLGDTQFHSPLYCSDGDFSECAIHTHFREATSGILLLAGNLIDLVISQQATTSQLVNTLGRMRAELETYSQHRELDTLSPDDSIQECCRLATLLLLNAIEYGVPLRLSDPLLVTRLARCLEKTDYRSNWGGFPGLLLWVSILGAACSRNALDGGVLLVILGRAMSQAAFTASEFGPAIIPIQRFIHFRKSLRREGGNRL